jgi:hypothetical protein
MLPLELPTPMLDISGPSVKLLIQIGDSLSLNVLNGV